MTCNDCILPSTLCWNTAHKKWKNSVDDIARINQMQNKKKKLIAFAPTAGAGTRIPAPHQAESLSFWRVHWPWALNINGQRIITCLDFVPDPVWIEEVDGVSDRDGRGVSTIITICPKFGHLVLLGSDPPFHSMNVRNVDGFCKMSKTQTDRGVTLPGFRMTGTGTCENQGVRHKNKRWARRVVN